MDRFYLGFKKRIQKDAIQAGLFIILILCVVFFSVVFLNKTLTSLQVPGVLGGGPYDYQGKFTHRALIDPGGSSWSPRPQAALEHQEFAAGRVPLWDPYMGVGQPLAGNMDSIALNPLRIALYLDPSPYMWDLFLLFRLFLAGMFAYLFMRAIKVSHLSGIFSSTLYMLSGYFIFSIDMHHLDTEIFLPFLLLCYEKIIQRANLLRWGILSSLAVVFLLSGGQPQSAALIMGLGFAYYFFRLLSCRENRTIKIVVKFTLNYISFVFLGIALSAHLLLPFLEFWRLSFNNHDPRMGHALGLSFDPYFADAVSFVVPYFMGPIHHSWLQDYSWHILTRGYFGMSAAIFALAAVLVALRQKSSNNYLEYFFATFLLLMIGKLYGFFWANWIGHLPIANMINYGKYMGSLMAFCVAALAGLGLEAIIKSEIRAVILKNSAQIVVVLISFCFVYDLSYMLDHANAYSQLAGYSKFFKLPLVYFVLLTVVVAIFFMSFIFMTMKVCQSGATFKAKKFQIIVLIIALVELYIYVPNPGLLKNRNERADILNSAPYINFIQAHLENYRVVGVDRVLYPDFGSAFGIGDIRVLDALLPKRYMEFLGNFFKLPNPPDRFTGDEGIDFQDKGIQRALNLLGIKYIISNSDITEGNGFIEDILNRGQIVEAAGHPVSNWINSSMLDINGVSKKILFAHAPAKINYAFKVPDKSYLEFSIGMVPGSWLQSDGVLYEITLKDREGEKRIFSKYINPRNNLQDRKWFENSIDLSFYAGREVVLSLVTSPGPNNDNAFDWSAWGGLRLKTQKNDVFSLVYDHEVKIYENKEVLPRAFVVYDYEIAKASGEVLKRLKDLEFPLSNRIILEAPLPENTFSKIDNSALKKSEAQILHYDTQLVETQAEMMSPGFLVLSDLYYPGWEVYVDGKKGKIYQADYMLRAVFLGEGKHIVKFVYEPFSFRVGVWISGSAALLIVILLLGKAFLTQRKRKLINTEN